MVERTESTTKDFLGETRFELGRITNIYPERGTVDFRSEMSEQYRNDIPYVMPYFDQSQGTGICFNPEPGTTAICATTSDGLSMIFAFIGIDEQGSYLCGRQRGNPGDIFITGKDGNFVQVRRGGILQIGSTPLCQTVYLPIRNIIQNYSENFEVYTLCGTLKFNVLRDEDSSEGHSRCQYTLDIKEYADDKDPIVNISTGSLDSNNIFSISTRDKGGGKITVSLKIDKEGNLNLSTESNYTLKARKDINIESGSNINSKSKNNTSIAADNKIEVEGLSLSLKGTQSTDLTSNGIVKIEGSKVQLGRTATFPVMRMSPDMDAFFKVVAAACNALTLPVTIPVAGTSPDVVA